MRFTGGTICRYGHSFRAEHFILTHTGGFRQASSRESDVGCKGVYTVRTMPGTISFHKNVQCALGY
jgi:hypothetical protein